MSNAVYAKNNGKVEKQNLRKTINNGTQYLKCKLKPSYMLNKTFDNNLVAIRKSKLALSLKNVRTLECAYQN